MRRFRRPQLALIGLVVALVIGYIVQAVTSGGSESPRPAPAVTAPPPASAALAMSVLGGMPGSGSEMLPHVKACAATLAAARCRGGAP